jgi:tetratricopeptide (TPR) repeat protein
MKRMRIFAAGVALVLAGLLAGCQTNSRLQVEPRWLEFELSQRAAAYAHYAAGIVAEVNGQPLAAAEEFFEAARLECRDAELLADVSRRLIESRQFERALVVLQWAARLPEADGTTFLRLGFVHAQLGHPNRALAANRQAVQRLPGFLPAAHNLYLSYVQLGQSRQALAVLDEAALQAGRNAEYRVSLAELYAACGQQFPALREETKEKALALLRQAERDDSLRGMNRLKLADGFYLCGDHATAAKLYLEFLVHGEPPAPLRDILRAKLTEIYLRAKDRTRAVEQLTAITRESPANAGAHYFLGVLAMEEQRWPEAQDCFERALAINADFEAARLDLAAAQVAAGQPEAALENLRVHARRRPATFASEYLSGMACYVQEKYGAALTHFTTAEALARGGDTNRLDAGFYFQLGAASERAGRRADAAKYFEQVLALAPDHAEALNYLGYMWAERGENLERAHDLIERALKLEPDNAAFLDSMGWVLFQLGNARAALPFLERAVARLETPDATVYDHLGDVRAALNQMDAAREAWAKSLAVEPNPVIQQKLQAAPPKAKP